MIYREKFEPLFYKARVSVLVLVCFAIVYIFLFFAIVFLFWSSKYDDEYAFGYNVAMRLNCQTKQVFFYFFKNKFNRFMILFI